MGVSSSSMMTSCTCSTPCAAERGSTWTTTTPERCSGTWRAVWVERVPVRGRKGGGGKTPRPAASEAQRVSCGGRSSLGVFLRHRALPSQTKPSPNVPGCHTCFVHGPVLTSRVHTAVRALGGPLGGRWERTAHEVCASPTQAHQLCVRCSQRRGDR